MLAVCVLEYYWLTGQHLFMILTVQEDANIAMSTADAEKLENDTKITDDKEKNCNLKSKMTDEKSNDSEKTKQQNSDNEKSLDESSNDSLKNNEISPKKDDAVKNKKTNDDTKDLSKNAINKDDQDSSLNDTKSNDESDGENANKSRKIGDSEEHDETEEDEEGTEKDSTAEDAKDEEEDEEEEDEEEDEEDDDEDMSFEKRPSKKKGVPLLDQPLEKSGTRERKKVQRFNEDLKSSEKEAKFELPNGSGTQLGDIEAIDVSIQKFKADDLKTLHRILFKTPGKTALIKKNIKRFNGFEFEKDTEDYDKKLQFIQKLEVKSLRTICDILDLEKKGTKDELGERVLDFLLEPKKADSKSVGATSTGGRPKRSAAAKANDKGFSSNEGNSDASGDDDYSDRTSKRPMRARRAKGKRVNLKDESSSASERDAHQSDEVSDAEMGSSDDEVPRVVGRGGKKGKKKKDSDSEEEISEFNETESSDESDEPKKRRRGSTNRRSVNNRKRRPSGGGKGRKGGRGRKPAAAPKGKKEQPKRTSRGRPKKPEVSDEEMDSDARDSSSEDEPLVKKSKPNRPPSDEEIKNYIKEILEGANLEEITMKTVCKQVCAHYPDFDLAHKKDFIKTTVKLLIST